MKISDTHLGTACQKYTISAIGVKKNFEASDTELERRQSSEIIFFDYFFPQSSSKHADFAEV